MPAFETLYDCATQIYRQSTINHALFVFCHYKSKDNRFAVARDRVLKGSRLGLGQFGAVYFYTRVLRSVHGTSVHVTHLLLKRIIS